ncbi:hypothetical protein Dcar01_00453 [Deinococcus carri]|uniref:Intracellular proteinase inhibitor BsuPI domain-containing protein n=1 Tax=Deinococcus carri TaxID=1211323 RepID=A0ABP9W315_9DEIO
MKRLLVVLLPALLGSCAVLGGMWEPLPAPAVLSSPAPASPLTARAGASLSGREVTVVLTLQNGSGQALALRYAAQVNWGSCGLPPYVALTRAGGAPVPAPTSGERLTCPELQFTRTLAPGETLTLKRTLPPLAPGTYTLTAWFDGTAGGGPLRVQAAPVVLEVR